MKPKERESDILRTISEGLSALRIWHMRCNSGAMFGEYAGKKRMLRFGRRGMADVLALPRICEAGHINCTDGDKPHCGPTVFWLEIKRPGEKQSPDQIAFEQEVTAEGHRYLVAHSWEDVRAALTMSK